MSDYSELKRRALASLECRSAIFQKEFDTEFERAAQPGVIWGLIGELEVADKVIAERNRLLSAIPACPVHGQCVPHAIELVEKAVFMLKELKAENEALRRGIDPKWAMMDQEILINHLRHNTNFDADKFDAMIRFAVESAQYVELYPAAERPDV